MEKILRQTKSNDNDIIVVTDGERILGLGDVGIGGMAIPIGKSALYTLFGGIRPERMLPVFLDVGTNNEALLKDPLYIGYRKNRIRGPAYDNFVDAFVKSIKSVYPRALLQWEDFAKEHAQLLLERYEKILPSFNDDIQGTAAVVLAGLISATKLKGSTLQEEKIAIFGAGSAGLGIAHLIVDYLIYLGLSHERAYQNIYLVDREGLENSGPFGKAVTLKTLEEVISFARITILIGTSAQPKAFTESIIKKMVQTTDRPIVFPLSNPNSKAEADPADIYRWTDGKALVATGSPFPGTPQCNNVYIFPAIGLVASCVRLKEIPNAFFLVAAEALSKISGNQLFPRFFQLRKATQFIAQTVMQYALEKNLTLSTPQDIEESMWYPDYESYEI